jgi:ribosomal protein S30
MNIEKNTTWKIVSNKIKMIEPSIKNKDYYKKRIKQLETDLAVAQAKEETIRNELFLTLCEFKDYKEKNENRKKYYLENSQ